MTTNPTPIPEPTSPTAVVVGKRDGKTVVAVRNKYCPGLHWAVLLLHEATPTFYRWSGLCEELTDIRVVDVAEVASKPEPGPWLRGDELEAVVPTLKAGDVVEVDERGHTATGELWADRGFLSLWRLTVRTTIGKPGPRVDALRIIERAPEPDPGVRTSPTRWWRRRWLRFRGPAIISLPTCAPPLPPLTPSAPNWRG